MDATVEHPEGLVAQVRERLGDVVELAPMGIGVVTLDGRVLMSNDALRQMLGYSEDEFAAMSFDEYTHPDDVERNRVLFEQLVAGEIDRFELEKRFLHADGHLVWGRLTSSLLRDEHGQPHFVIGMLQDVTETRRLQLELEAAEERYRTLVEQVPAIVYVAPPDLDSPWTYVSPRIEELLGRRSEDPLRERTHFRDLVVDEDRPTILAAFDELGLSGRVGGQTTSVSITFRIRGDDGQLRWIRDDFAIVEDADGRTELRGVLLDVTREKQLESELEYLAFHDPLTQLANLRRFREAVAEYLAQDVAAGAVLYLDLDGFKDVNDTLGHDVGDRLLQTLAARLRGALRGNDLAGRLGGDEFAVLLRGVVDEGEAMAIAKRLHDLIAAQVTIGEHRLHIGASIGLAMLESDGSAESVLRDADLAMYRAKDLGKGGIVAFEPSLLEASQRRFATTAM
ncbi:MAG: diguanylate cyclase domain-containing protein [Nitriliruptoraceae bacterium]